MAQLEAGMTEHLEGLIQNTSSGFFLAELW